MTSPQWNHSDPMEILKDIDDTDKCLDEQFENISCVSRAITSMSEMNQELKNLTHGLNVLKEKYYEKEMNEQKIRTQIQEITKSNEKDFKEIQELTEQITQLQTQCNSRQNYEISSSDKEVIRRARKRLSVYTEITGIHWDFTAPDHLVKGFIKNKERMYSKPFQFNKNEMPHSKIKELLYQELCKAASADWSKINEEK